ncbi:tRNA pseudouridine(55) synthase TruB [Psychroserpens sp.]|uniref:tRNA pseudouridine(55) synthase TruB n=1 Tax=Psychroserpens sp. TaxID=2020870 RepID=UPI001B16CD51|nr:tRNA pseudouridine(55) synthase TruB [Psychroserpens sp.]MBO6605627.1 tRNA pseudouridine(55) synthase TruB [Psychroserpens sp.]MBO6631170.1 tRNA pseudouridine(55) synthase TruB [Psychroserpens sp.]MBO6653564.1 tRNA pseudouridine(55) synthase TruB [Psychroserpens sp.]MBO6681885.1 tRNA pseudouridine(55) synthase TruB [Psychroserpens sp.]MBO6749001.1 tRNA pseudouridine(55) synthase TruB [Psychroserpens sp.]
MNTSEDFKSGQILLIDKPLNWTSFQVVNKLRWEIRRAFNIKKIKVGHAGTLDPLATGLLIICTGKMTKQINTFQGQDKEYTGTIILGSTTPSYDLETEIDKTYPTDHIDASLIHNTAKTFIGEIEQYPPIFSAVKKDGKRLYEYARAGESVEIKSRTITISEFEITNIDGAALNFRVVCSKGTYIRSLANDFGKALNSGAHLSVLRRTKIGEFDVIDAISPTEFISTIGGSKA